jgi:hypothetical protein
MLQVKLRPLRAGVKLNELMERIEAGRPYAYLKRRNYICAEFYEILRRLLCFPYKCGSTLGVESNTYRAEHPTKAAAPGSENESIENPGCG